MDHQKAAAQFATQAQAAAQIGQPRLRAVGLVSSDGRRVIVDPFHNGRIMEAPALRELLKVVAGQAEELDSGHYKDVSNRDILIRLQNNVKSRRLDLELVADALEALERSKTLNPGEAGCGGAFAISSPLSRIGLLDRPATFDQISATSQR